MPKVQSKAIMWHTYVASMAHPETEEFKLSLETKNVLSSHGCKENIPTVEEFSHHQCGIPEPTDSLKHNSSMNFPPTLGTLTLKPNETLKAMLTLPFCVLAIGWDFE